MYCSVARLTWFAGTPDDPVGAGLPICGFGDLLAGPALPLALQQQIQVAGIGPIPRGQQAGQLSLLVFSAPGRDPRAELTEALAAAAAGPLREDMGWVCVEIEDPEDAGSTLATAALTPAALPSWEWSPPTGSGAQRDRSSIRWTIQYSGVVMIETPPPPAPTAHVLLWDDSSAILA